MVNALGGKQGLISIGGAGGIVLAGILAGVQFLDHKTASLESQLHRAMDQPARMSIESRARIDALRQRMDALEKRLERIERRGR